jgi:hypothetical protein
MLQHVVGVAGRDLRAGFGVEKHTVIGDREDARQFMSNDYDRRALGAS